MVKVVRLASSAKPSAWKYNLNCEGGGGGGEGVPLFFRPYSYRLFSVSLQYNRSVTLTSRRTGYFNSLFA